LLFHLLLGPTPNAELEGGIFLLYLFIHLFSFWLILFMFIISYYFKGDEKMFQKLADKAGDNILNQEERVILYTKFPNEIQVIKKNLLSIYNARQLYKKIRTTLRTKTIKIMKENGYIFDGLIGGNGGGKALLYNVIKDADFNVLCGKVYLIDSENQPTIHNEVSMSNYIHSNSKFPFIVKYSPIIEFYHHDTNNQKSIALIMPLYPLSLALVLEAYGEMPIPFTQFQTLVNCLLQSIEHLRSLKLAHCDIKPENIMIDNSVSPSIFVLIDLGAVTEFGKEVKEYTPGYSLFESIFAVNENFDIMCILTTLVRCCCPNFDLKQSTTFEELNSKINELNKPDTSSYYNKFEEVLKMIL
jgi:serine/threonine protein kinase